MEGEAHVNVANAGDADPQALSSLLVKILPYLTSLVEDLASWNADRLAKKPRPGELVKIEVEVPLSSETDESRCFVFFYRSSFVICVRSRRHYS
jgi:hypothetical protein